MLFTKYPIYIKSKKIQTENISSQKRQATPLSKIDIYKQQSSNIQDRTILPQKNVDAQEM